jgi:ATP-binding cassette subfamily B protein
MLAFYSRLATIRPLGGSMRPFPGTRKSGKTSAAFRNIGSLARLLWATDSLRCSTSVCLRAISSVLPIATLWVGKRIVDAVAALTRTHDPRPIWHLLGIEAGLLLAADGALRAVATIESILGEQFSHRLLTKVLGQANRLDLHSFEEPDFHDRLERARTQATSRLGVLSAFFQSAQQLVTVGSLLMGALALAPWLALAQVLSVAPAVVSEAYFTTHWHRLYMAQTSRRREIDYAVSLGTSLATAKEVRAFQLGRFLETWVERVGTALWRANAKLTVHRNIVGGALNVLGLIAYYLGYAYIAWRATEGLASVGDVVLLAGLLQRTRSEVQGIFSRLTRSVEDAVLLGDLFDFLRLEPTLLSPERTTPGPRRTDQGIRVDRVGFCYPGSAEPVLDRCSFRIEPGTRLALVGENGSGKTTLVKLLLRMYDPTEGRILLDGVDLREYDLETLRGWISTVFQDFVRYDLTVRQNLGVARIKDSIPDQELWRGLRISNGNRFVERLPQQLDQVVGKRFERGIELSGGQWQQLAIARAWLRDGRLVILDEPTAAVDAKAERELLSSLMHLTANRMALLISHRFSRLALPIRSSFFQAAESLRAERMIT